MHGWLIRGFTGGIAGVRLIDWGALAHCEEKAMRITVGVVVV